MRTLKAFMQQFNWKIIMIRILTNSAALLLTVAIVPDLYLATRTFSALVIIAIGLGVLNAIVKPVILLLTGQFIFATFGLLVILVNTLILYLLERLFPSILVVDNLFWAIIAGAVIGLISNALENLLGLTPPIVSDQDIEVRKLIKAGLQPSLANLVAKPPTVLAQDVETQSVADLAAAKAALETIQTAGAGIEALQPPMDDLSELPESIPPPTESPPNQVPEPLESPPEENTNKAPHGGAQ
jgi:putative membrane protein